MKSVSKNGNSMIGISERLRNWRSRHRLTKHEAAQALQLTIGTVEEIERGTEPPRGPKRDSLLEKLSRPPHSAIRSSLPDPGFRPGQY